MCDDSCQVVIFFISHVYPTHLALNQHILLRVKQTQQDEVA